MARLKEMLDFGNLKYAHLLETSKAATKHLLILGAKKSSANRRTINE